MLEGWSVRTDVDEVTWMRDNTDDRGWYRWHEGSKLYGEPVWEKEQAHD